MPKMINLSGPVSKAEAEINTLRHSLWKRVNKLAKAIGPWQAAGEMAIMSCVMIEGYTEAGQPKPEPVAHYDDFAKRAEGIAKRKSVPDSDALRHSIWKRVLELVDSVGPYATMFEMIMQSDMMIACFKDEGRLKPGPKVQNADFAKHADGTSLL